VQTGTTVSTQERTLVPGTDLRAVPWWALIVVGTGFLLLYLILADPDYRDTFLFIARGIKVTLRITLSAYAIAVTWGLIVGLGRTSKNPIIYNLATLYVEVLRGIPMIVQILYMAFVFVPLVVGLGKTLGEWGLTWAQGTPLEGMFAGLAGWSVRSISLEMRAILALGLGYAAYEAEVFRAGIQSIGKGQWEAAYSIGMTYFQTLRLVILPQAIRRVLPPLGNDFVALLKDSSLATVIAVREITQLSRLRKAATFRPKEAFNVVAFLYLSMTLFLSSVVRYIERRMKVPH